MWEQTWQNEKWRVNEQKQRYGRERWKSVERKGRKKELEIDREREMEIEKRIPENRKKRERWIQRCGEKDKDKKRKR